MTGRRKLARQFRNETYAELSKKCMNYKLNYEVYRETIRQLNKNRGTLSDQEAWDAAVGFTMITFSPGGGGEWYPPAHWINLYKNPKRACKEAVKFYYARYSFLDDVLASVKYTGELPQVGAGLLRYIWSE